MTTTTTYRDVCARSECGEGNVHFAHPVTAREMRADIRCVDRWKSVALLQFIARASLDGIFLDADSLRFTQGSVSGPEAWPIGAEPEYVPCAEEEATHVMLHWRMDVVR
jgi:hypothetical protein